MAGRVGETFTRVRGNSRSRGLGNLDRKNPRADIIPPTGHFMKTASLLLAISLLSGATRASVSSYVLSTWAPNDPAAAAAMLMSLPPEENRSRVFTYSTDWLSVGTPDTDPDPQPIVGEAYSHEGRSVLTLVGSGAVPASISLVAGRGGREGGELHLVTAADFFVIPADPSKPDAKTLFSYSGSFDVGGGDLFRFARRGLTLQVTATDGSTSEVPLQFTVVPEPGVLALVPATACLALRRRRRI